MPVKSVQHTHPALIPMDTAVPSPSYFLFLHHQHFRPQQREDESAKNQKFENLKILYKKRASLLIPCILGFFLFVFKLLTKMWNCIIICTVTPTTGLTPVRNQCWIKIRRNIISDSKMFSPSVIYDLMASHWTYIHGGVNFGNSFVLCGELIDLHSITD